MTHTAFDLNEYRRVRVRELESRCDFLEGERDRLENILAALLRMAARTAKCDPMLILNACLTIVDTNPALAQIHQPLEDDRLAPDQTTDAAA